MQTTIFDTALGEFGLGWTETGIARVQLPGLDHGGLLARINRQGAVTGTPPNWVEAVIGAIEDYADGEKVDFAGVKLDLAGVPQFQARAYALLLTFGYGQVTTYGALARQLGDVQLSRAVGQAMGANPIPLIIPCHRVLASGGKRGGFSAPGGADSKMRMLALEGVRGLPGEGGQLGFGF